MWLTKQTIAKPWPKRRYDSIEEEALWLTEQAVAKSWPKRRYDSIEEECSASNAKPLPLAKGATTEPARCWDAIEKEAATNTKSVPLTKNAATEPKPPRCYDSIEEKVKPLPLTKHATTEP